MYAKVRHLKKCFILPLLALLTLLVGCNLAPQGESPTSPAPSATQQTLIIGPQAARDVALAYLRTYHSDKAPPENAIWFEETVSAEGLVGSSTFLYRYQSWLLTVTYPIVAPEATIFTVTAEDSATGFRWQGLVDAYGQVVEMEYIVGGTPTPTIAVTFTLTPTPMPSPTDTAIATATATPTPTKTPFPTFTPTPDSCNTAQFVTDVTIQDGTNFYPGTAFTKTWRLKNTGVCTWTDDYDIVFVKGDLMDGNSIQALPGQVRPGETVDLSMAMKAPQRPGSYQGFWMLRDPRGVLFGLGNRADQPFWVQIEVSDFNESNSSYDFALSYCSATWKSDTTRLPCPGFTGSEDGFVVLLSHADLENRSEDEPTLWVHPNAERYGWIEGTYPAYRVASDDVFAAWVGCLNGYNLCSLKFYLDYQDENGTVNRLGEWIETYDGQVTQIQIDLSALAGRNVRFILGTEALTRNVDHAQGFWFVPRIK